MPKWFGARKKDGSVTDKAVRALELAQDIVGRAFMMEFGEPIEVRGRTYTPSEMQDEFERAINSLRQQQPQYDDLEVFRRINAAVARHGSIAAAARHFGVHKQSLFAALNSDRACPPAVLQGIGLRKVGGRTRYEDVSDAC
jgi:DNA-binding phage protein